MGYQQPGQCGAILADQMGLGKTLQCIALLYTLLKQGPYGRPVVQRALVVTPASLTANWGKEFIKWLGRERLSVYTADTSTMVEEYSRRLCPVLVVSYEVAMRCCELLKSMAFDIIICDEAHRLKNCSLKTFSQLASLPCPRRLLLTGTPIQNNLQELFSLVEFVNPGVLGSSTSFRHVYEDPIVASQQPQATVVQQTLGESRAAELNRVTSAFVLRRTQDIIDRWLPTRVEHVVFCHLSPTQRSLYIAVLACRSLNRCVRSAEPGDHLAAIQVLRKLCNHPALLCAHNLPQDSPSQLASEVLSLLPPHLQPGHYSEEDSGKLGVVSRVLAELWQGNRERMVLVSNFTRTLDLLAALCDRHHYPFMRLDGSTPTAKRQQLVDSFNSPNSTHFVFLLSARAGGVGLNLTGASRILLYDVDWNPATDLQAQARVWRDGQTKPVHVYRLVATGSVEEKIFQRQVRKQGLSGAVVESSSSSSTPATFSTQELQDLFRLHEDTACLTHDLMQCGCNLHGSSTSSRTPQLPAGPLQRDCQLGQEATEASTATLDQLHHWTHLAPPFPHTLLKDECLEAASEFISCVFSHQSSTNTALPSPT